MTSSLRRRVIRAVLITGALTTIATSEDALDTRVHEVRAATTERGLMLTAHMTPEVMATAREVDLRIWWQAGLGASQAVLLVTPESDALEPVQLTLVQPTFPDDAGNPTSGGYAWQASYYDIMPACSGAGECTVRFWIAPEPGSSTVDLTGILNAQGAARGHSGGDCEENPRFSEAAAVTLTFGEIEQETP